MFGTVARMRPKPGKEQAVVALFQEWERQRQPRVKGAVAGYLFRPEKNSKELIAVAVFSSKETYFANAQDPEQDRWYRRLRELLEADPEWTDGEVLSGSPRG